MSSFVSALLGRTTQFAGPTSQPGNDPAIQPDPSIAVSVTNVTKEYKGFKALDDVTFAVRCGESLGIVGYNGAGKSTLLQVIAGTLEPTAGDVTIKGRVVALLELGAGFNDDFTGVENVFMNASILGIPRKTIESRLPEIEAFAEIGDFIHRPVKTYSSGMRVRLAFSLLTQVDPDVMIIDEALSVGDAYFSHKCARVIQRFRQQGRTLLFVSHDPSAVRTFCDRAILLDHGAKIKDGTPVAVLDYYNAMVAAREEDTEIRLNERDRGNRIIRSGNQRATIDTFELLDENDRPVRTIGSGATVRICCVITVNEIVENPTVGFLIRDRLGNDAFGTNTSHLGRSLGTLTKGQRIEVSFPVEITLGPGNYTITLAVHQGTSHAEENFDWCDHVLAFSVVHTWPFIFVGVAALQASAEVSHEIRRLKRNCEIGANIFFGETGNAYRFQLEGWSFPEEDFCWTNGMTAQLAFDLPESPSSLELEVEASPFTAPKLNYQRVEVLFNDVTAGSLKLVKPGIFRWRLPGGVSFSNLRVTMLLPDAKSPHSLGLTNDPRILGISVRRLSWRILEK